MGYIILICIIMGAYFIALYKSSCKNNDELTQVFSNEKIQSVEQARYIEEQDKLKRDIESLRLDIQNNIDFRSKINENDKAINEFYISEYEKLLKTPIYTRTDFDEVYWLYNYGKLRTQNEIYVHSGEYQKDCQKTNAACYTIPFFIGWGIPVIFFVKELHGLIGFIAGAVIGIIPGGFLALIFGMIGHQANISKGKSLNTPEATDIIKKETFNRNIAIASTAISTVSVARHAKRTVKDISNVDGWKEMK